MKFGSIAACAALLALTISAGAPAFAQLSARQQLDDTLTPCLDANNDKANPPQDDVMICEATLVKIDEIFAGLAAPTPHEINLKRMYRAFAHTAIGGGYAQIDAVRSSRVCTKSEAAWTELSQLVDADSPASFLATYDKMRTAAVGPITKCRAEKGTPPGAAPLPQ